MHKINLWSALLLLNLSLILQIGCGKKTIEQSVPEAVAPYKITITQGGGFTGATQGYTISSDGKVETFQQMPGKEKSITLSAMAKADQVKDYHQWFENSGLLNEELNEKGNMTTTVRYETADTSYVWSVPTTSKVGSPGAKKLNALCTEVISSIKNVK